MPADVEISLPSSVGQLLAKPLGVARALEATGEGVADEELEATGGEAQELT